MFDLDSWCEKVLADIYLSIPEPDRTPEFIGDHPFIPEDVGCFDIDAPPIQVLSDAGVLTLESVDGMEGVFIFLTPKGLTRAEKLFRPAPSVLRVKSEEAFASTLDHYKKNPLWGTL